jgi:hypothetical protein
MTARPAAATGRPAVRAGATPWAGTRSSGRRCSGTRSARTGAYRGDGAELTPREALLLAPDDRVRAPTTALGPDGRRGSGLGGGRDDRSGGGDPERSGTRDDPTTEPHGLSPGSARQCLTAIGDPSRRLSGHAGRSWRSDTCAEDRNAYASRSPSPARRECRCSGDRPQRRQLEPHRPRARNLLQRHVRRHRAPAGAVRSEPSRMPPDRRRPDDLIVWWT